MQPCSSPPLKRARECIKVLPDGASKCAEIFVTNNADKWTLFCAYCQMATNDIGVFICHIRLEHLNVPPAEAQSSQTAGGESNINQNYTKNYRREPIITDISNATSTKEVSQQQHHPPASGVIKEELIIDSKQEDLLPICSNNTKTVDSVASLNQLGSEESERLSVKKDPSEQLNEEFFAITAVDHYSDQQDPKEIVQVIYMNDEAEERNQSDKNSNINKDKSNNDIKDIDNPDCYTRNDDEKTARASRTRKIKSKPNCKTHEKKYHKQLPFKCNICHKSFISKLGLKLHSKSQHKRSIFKCTVCPAEHPANHFITHVLTHESGSCFPCQVCGKVYPNDKERRKHWETHAEERPFYCKICYRRYQKQQLLKYHLKTHNRYQCNFCPAEFVAPEVQRPPYICRKCENLSVIAPKPAIENEDIIEIDSNSESIANEDSNTHVSYLNDDNLLSEDEASDLELIEDSYNDNVPSGSSSTQISQTLAAPDGIHKILNKCQYCNRGFVSIKGLIAHISKMHEKNEQFTTPYMCRYCQRTFQTRSGLAMHLKTHDKKNQFNCPICPLTEFRESSFITHVLQHENDSCFPCQVCAKILPTNQQRLEHWKIHLEERPYGCNLCFRRFYKRHVLKNHMKSHGLYYCHFCGDHFNSADTLHPPYICMSCEKLPDIKNKMEQRKSLANKNYVFDSDEEE